MVGMHCGEAVQPLVTEGRVNGAAHHVIHVHYRSTTTCRRAKQAQNRPNNSHQALKGLAASSAVVAQQTDGARVAPRQTFQGPSTAMTF